MGEQLQSLGLVPTLSAIKPHGPDFIFYFCTLLGWPNINVSDSREYQEEEEAGRG